MTDHNNDVVLSFPPDFTWGASISGYQCEGSNPHADWHHWEPGNILDGSTNIRSCDYWTQYKTDHELLTQLNIPAFRLSIEWSRIEPKQGCFDQVAINHYHELLSDLKQRNISIYLTLFHWVLPKWVADEGGWTNPDIIGWFSRFIQLALDEFHTYTHSIITLNEPMVPLSFGYLSGMFPPEKKSVRRFLGACSNKMKATLKANQLICQLARQKGKKNNNGIAQTYPAFEPYHKSGPLRLYEHLVGKLSSHIAYDWWDRTLNKQPDQFAFCGINYYFRMFLKFNIHHSHQLFIDESTTPNESTQTQMGWPIHPESFYDVMSHVYKRFKKPIIITENGIADPDDTLRPAYIIKHLQQIHRAIQDGIPVKGYFYWSLMDNFEWKEGFNPRFGLVAVDRSTSELTRQIRKSGYLYRDIIRHNGLTRSMLQLVD